MRALIPIALGCTLAALASAPHGLALPQNGDHAGEAQPDLPPDLEIPPAPVLSPAEEHATLQVPRGFVVELVAAEPLVVDPVQVTFDELGRLWVVEMRGYMPDIVGNGEREPVGAIAILTDTDGDGSMDERTEFASGLILPRGVVPMHGGALCLLPPELVFLRDDDGDGVFDTREVVATGLTKGLDNPEHDVNSPLLGLDNWVRFSNWGLAVRRVFTEDGEPEWLTRRDAGGGQWGLSMDDHGRLMRNTNPNPLYVDVVPSHYAVRNPHQRRFLGAVMNVGATNEVFPRRINTGVNRGYQEVTLRDDFTLHYFTAACSPTVLRGSGLGDDADGDVFVCEPTGNLVKRYDLARKDGSAELVARSEHAKYDFLTGTDERFRPVAMTTAPDGTLIVADMYRGLIQHRIFLTSFLRKQIEERGLAGPMGLGRIWRVRRADFAPSGPPVNLIDTELIDLVAYLDSQNSWQRDHAQRLLVEMVDGERNVIAGLREMALESHTELGAIHALWTLDGVGYLDDATLSRAVASGRPGVMAAAAEIAESRVDLEGNDLAARLARVAKSDGDARARLHALLALGASGRDELVLPAFTARMTVDASSRLERSAVVSGLAYREAAMLAALTTAEAWTIERPGRAALLKDLAICVGREGLLENIESVVELALHPPARWWSDPLMDGLYATRRKGPKGQSLPIALRAIPVSLPAAQAGETGCAEHVAAKVDDGCAWPGKPGAIEIELPRDLTEPEKLQFEAGRRVFEQVCSTCHQSHGAGQIGKAPTLRGTRYVVGDELRLMKILLHGLEGELEIDGETWNQEMPRFEGSDEDLAAALTYIRRSWGNGADPIPPEAVTAARQAAAGRKRPMTAADLE